MDGLDALLSYGEDIKEEKEPNPIAVKIDSISGLVKLEKIQFHPDIEVFNKLSEIINHYFCIA